MIVQYPGIVKYLELLTSQCSIYITQAKYFKLIT